MQEVYNRKKLPKNCKFPAKGYSKIELSQTI